MPKSENKHQKTPSEEELGPVFNENQAKMIASMLLETTRDLKDDFYDRQLELAHEINNPVNLILTAIDSVEQNIEELTTSSDVYQKKNKEEYTATEHKGYPEKEDVLTAKEEMKSAFEIIKRACFKVKEITSFISTEDEKELLADIHINECLEASIALRTAKSHAITLHKSFEENLPCVKAPKGRLNQVFTNLLQNAYDAILAKESVVAENIHIATYSENEEVVIRIKDTGVGMSSLTQEKLFERYYTTKYSENKRGIGMYLVQKIIHSCQGRISFETQEGQGTEFMVRLPYTLR